MFFKAGTRKPRIIVPPRNYVNEKIDYVRPDRRRTNINGAEDDDLMEGTD